MHLTTRLKYAIKTMANVHRAGSAPDIFLFATPRGGSTWLMEIIASQPGLKFYDEPLNPRRENVAWSGRIPNWESLMPDTGDAEQVIGFLQDLQAGRHGFMNPTPFRRHHRFFTNRIVFKIHEIEHLIDEVARRCSAQIVYLLRHPIATSISRHVLPRLDLFFACQYHTALLNDPVCHAEIVSTATHGSFFQRAVISWCYENLVALRSPNPDWLFVTYEELVLNPERSCDLLLGRLQLSDRAAMLQAFERPASNIELSHEQTLAALHSPDARQRRYRLVAKWQNEISLQQYAEAEHVLALFKVDAYDVRSPLAAGHFLHFDDTEVILQNSATIK